MVHVALSQITAQYQIQISDENTINEDKTEFVIFSRNPDKYSEITLQIGTDNIKPSDYVKILGVTLDSSMKP